MQAELAAMRADADASSQRLAVLEKERVAISAILEGKIAKLVDSIAAASAAGTPGGPGGGGAAGAGGAAAAAGGAAKWARELTALQRLVHASVAALKQA